MGVSQFESRFEHNHKPQKGLTVPSVPPAIEVVEDDP